MTKYIIPSVTTQEHSLRRNVIIYIVDWPHSMQSSGNHIHSARPPALSTGLSRLVASAVCVRLADYTGAYAAYIDMTQFGTGLACFSIGCHRQGEAGSHDTQSPRTCSTSPLSPCTDGPAATPQLDWQHCRMATVTSGQHGPRQHARCPGHITQPSPTTQPGMQQEVGASIYKDRAATRPASTAATTAARPPRHHQRQLRDPASCHSPMTGYRASPPANSTRQVAS